MSGGIFSKANRPLLPGVYTNEEATAPDVIQPNLGGVVAIPFTHDWGPFKVATHLNSFAEFEAQFGKSSSPGRIAVAQAFRGEGVNGRGGAGQVLAYRTGGSSAAKASKSLQNTTPASAVTLTAKYEGTRGNALRVTTQDNAADSSKTDLLLIDSATGLTLETYTFADTNISTDTNGLVAQINGTSDYITATGVIDGVALGVVTSQAFTGGNDGTTLASGDWTAAMSALEVERFSVFAPYDLTDGSILTSLKTWAVNLNNAGKRFLTVVGGATDETVTTANTRSASLGDSNFINFGVGSVTDDDFGVLSTSQGAPRIAGIYAARGEVDSATYARLPGWTIRTGPTEAQKLTAFKGGTLVLGRDSNAVPVRLEKSVTTYTTTTDATKPYVIYRNPKFVRTIHGIEMEITEWAEAHIIGQVNITGKVRDAVLAELASRLARRVDVGIIQPGPTVAIDTDPPPTPQDEFIALVYGIAFGRSVEQVFNTIRAS